MNNNKNSKNNNKNNNPNNNPTSNLIDIEFEDLNYSK
jgi:hypothetical protein